MVMNAMRQGAKSGLSKIILFGFMVMAVGGLVLMDVRGVFTGTAGGTGNVVTIGNDRLGIGQFDMLVRRSIARQGIDPQTAYSLGMIDQILNSEVSNQLLLRAARDTGINISDETMAQKIATIVAPYVNDTTSTKQAFQAIVAAQGMGEKEFVNTVRQEMTNELLRAALIMGSAVGDSAEAADLYSYTNEKRTLSALIMPDAQGLDVPESTDEVLLPLYQAGQERYAIPETRAITVAVLTEAAIKDAAKITDEDVKAQYEKDIDGYKLPEKRQLEQTILSERTEADAIAARIAKGETMEAAIKAQTGNADAYLGTASFEKKGLATEVADKAFSGKVGDVIGPVQTALGWHVMVLKAVEEPRTRPLAEVKDDVRKALSQSRVAEQMFETSGKIDDAIAAGTPLEDIAKDMEMKISAYGPVRADGSTAESKEGIKDYAADREEFLKTAFDLTEGELSHVIEMKDGSFAVLRVDSLTEKAYKPFDDVKADIAKVWEADQRQVLNKQRADKALARLQSGEVTLEKLAGEMKLSTKSLTLVRAEDPPAPLNNASKKLAFEPAVNGFVIAPVEGGIAVAQVKSVSMPDPAKADKEQMKTVAQAAANGSQEETLMTFLETLRKEYKVKINRALIEQTYGQPAAEQPQL